MEEIFVDSNVFLRFYVEDDEPQGAAAEKLFRMSAQKEVELITGPPVFFEVAWTLKVWAKWPNEKILEALQSMTAIPNMKILDKDTVIEAITLAQESRQEFADAYIAATARGRGAKVATFNKKHFVKLGSNLYPLSDKK
ncbi:MAG: PIN domain-containing protein [Synergistaceae bacterium]|jgi:predicted nucleic acid-binding protein|nr:PIN domain-containing protein [Synergistaceae bacterium]